MAKSVGMLIYMVCKKESHYRPGQALKFLEIWTHRFQDIRHMKVVRFSTIRTGRL